MLKHSPALFLALGIAFSAVSASAHVNPTESLLAPTAPFDRPSAVVLPIGVFSGLAIEQ